MAERVNLVDRTVMKRVISRLKVNSARNVNGVPKNPGNPDGLPFVHFLREQELLEEEQTTIAEKVVVDEQIDRNQRTNTETQKKKTTTLKNIVFNKKIFK